MERFVRKYDKECMKMMMMKHEETFRQQVHELHRLYRLQKLLMMDMENRQRFASDRKNAADSCPKGNGHRGGERRRRRVLNLELPADEYIERAEEEMVVEAEDGSDIELKLSIGNHHRSKGEDASLASDSGASFSSSSSDSGGGLRLQQAEAVSISYGNQFAEKNQFELDGISEEGLKQLPPWHLQCLTLKMV